MNEIPQEIKPDKPENPIQNMPKRKRGRPKGVKGKKRFNANE